MPISGDGAPPSDQDPYSSNDSSGGGTDAGQNYRVDATNFPKPLPFLGSLWGYNNELLAKLLRDRIHIMDKIVKRPASQEEVEAWTYWIAKQVQIQSYGPPIGIAGGAYRAYKTNATFRFPFWQPNLDTFNSRVFPSARFGLLNGNRAVMAWNLCRYFTYCQVGKWIGESVLYSYAATVAAVGELSDPRLKAVTDIIREKARQKKGSLQTPVPVPVQGKVQDDASPTGGFYGDESAGLGSTLGGSMSDSNLRQEEGRRQDWPQPVQPQNQNQPNDEPERSDTEFDDASSTGGRRLQSEPQTGSAWDRLRSARSTPGKGTSSWERMQKGQNSSQRQSSWSKLQNTQRESMEGSADTYSFSKSEEERNLAKAQAQREFDAQVDRERSGRDFNNNPNDRRS